MRSANALARYMWMNGYNVLHPMGWIFRAAGENAAIKNNTPPKEWTLSNIAAMKTQMTVWACLRLVARSYDLPPGVLPLESVVLSEDVRTGWPYRKKSKVNWCPQCCTVLAMNKWSTDCCRHEDTPVEQRELGAMVLAITKYADELLRDLEKLEAWPEKSGPMQRNWIGRSEGALGIRFGRHRGPAGYDDTVFTTRVDTIYGATSLQLGAGTSHC